jgi:hypothetical protein
MLTELLTAAAALALASTAFAYQLETKLSPDPAQMGKLTLSLKVKTDKGAVDAKAPVTAKAVMPATKDMMEMVSNGKIEKENPGSYTIRFNISMEGQWFLNIDVGEGKSVENFVFELNTGKPGLKKVKP